MGSSSTVICGVSTSGKSTLAKQLSLEGYDVVEVEQVLKLSSLWKLKPWRDPRPGNIDWAWWRGTEMAYYYALLGSVRIVSTHPHVFLPQTSIPAGTTPLLRYANAIAVKRIDTVYWLDVIPGKAHERDVSVHDYIASSEETKAEVTAQVDLMSEGRLRVQVLPLDFEMRLAALRSRLRETSTALRPLCR